jgi:hypothetical protein
MEEMHRSHKEPAWGWVGVLADWRRSRTRRVLRSQSRSSVKRGL